MHVDTHVSIGIAFSLPNSSQSIASKAIKSRALANKYPRVEEPPIAEGPQRDDHLRQRATASQEARKKKGAYDIYARDKHLPSVRPSVRPSDGTSVPRFRVSLRWYIPD